MRFIDGDLCFGRQHLSQSESYLIGSSETGSFSEACKKIYNTDGLKGFYKGYAARGTRLSVGLIIKATIIEKMDDSNKCSCSSVGLER